jgi:hypothetical protein
MYKICMFYIYLNFQQLATVNNEKIEVDDQLKFIMFCYYLCHPNVTKHIIPLFIK